MNHGRAITSFGGESYLVVTGTPLWLQWNSPELQEIRSYLTRGELSPYCRESLGCPIVQRVLAKEREMRSSEFRLRPPWQRVLNRLLFGLPAKIYRFFFD